MNSLLRLVLPAVLLVLGAGLSGADERPNILFIYTDDQAPWALGESGDPNASTPNLDQLAAQGMYLPHALTVTPVCSPSRVELWTSRYGSEMGINDWIKPLKRAYSDDPERQPGIDPSLPNLPKTLRSVGYHTALIGKYHLGEREASHPTEIGFDHFMGFLDGGTSPEDPRLEKDGETRRFEGLTTDILTDEALAYLEGRIAAEEPFFLSLHYRAPHRRWLPVAPADWAPFEDMDPELAHPDYPGLDVKRAKRWMREYLASVRGIDRNVGRLLQSLEDAGIEENTLVIYTSDHGYNMAHNGIWHKGNGHWLLKKDLLPPGTDNVPARQRPNLYDNSLLVPTLVRWPGTVEAGTESPRVVTNLDWFPTLAAIAGATIEKDTVLRGRNISPVLKGEAEEWNDEVFLQYSTEHQSRTHMRGWRSPRYKLVRDFLNPGRDEFYDLEADPEETTNLINRLSPEQAEVVADFDAKIRARMKEIGDPVAK